jgi:N-methylhydantoinase B/oxoprolinase/acetone carboxylase alpha subunit
VRNALIVLVVIALVLVALGAVNHGLLFDIDFVAGTWTAVSVFWVAVVTAGVVFVAGVVVAFLARSGAVAARRKLEKELQGTYERLRAAEAKLPRPALAQAAVVDVAPGEQTAVTGVAAASTADDTRTALKAMPEAETAVATATPEAETAVSTAAQATETVDTAEAPVTGVADAPPPAAS